MIGSGGDGGGKQVEQVDSIGKSIEERSAAWQSRAFRRVPDGVRDRELFGVWKARADVRSRRKSTQPAGSTRQILLLSIYLNTHGDLQNDRFHFITLDRFCPMLDLLARPWSSRLHVLVLHRLTPVHAERWKRFKERKVDSARGCCLDDPSFSLRLLCTPPVRLCALGLVVPSSNGYRHGC